MREAVEFVNRVLEAEHAAQHARLLEPDDARFREAWQALDELGAFPGLGSGIYRQPGSSVPSPEEAERSLRTFYALRRQMRGETFEHPEYGDVYVAIVSTRVAPGADGIANWSAAERLTVAQIDGAWRVTTREGKCPTCDATGTQGGRACPDCEGAGWQVTGGTRLKNLTGPLELYQFEPDESASVS